MAGGGILALLGGSKGKGGSEKSGPPALEAPEDTGGEVGDALGEMFEALQAGDNSGAALAFKRAYHACADESAGDDMDMGEEEPEMEL